jgi:GH15 family glucan-1,4-alpha-glucosidase
MRLEDYALLSDTHTAALVGRDGAIAWLCAPRFDAPACFAALLGDASHGRWLLAPRSGGTASSWRYRDASLVLESTWQAPEGKVVVTDFMPPTTGSADLVRVVRGVRGRVAMRLELCARFDYGSIAPWIRPRPTGAAMIAGPDQLLLQSPVQLVVEDATLVADFDIAERQTLAFVLSWQPSHERPRLPGDPLGALRDTETWWGDWSARSRYRGDYRDAVQGSLIVLKALTYAPSGAIVAAPTTSLPEELGGVRNWDYRFCWPRDAALTLSALLSAGYVAEARVFRDWLMRAVAGGPRWLQPVYGLDGERHVVERELRSLPGYERSVPVRAGNGAAAQIQLDVAGELCSTLHVGRGHKLNEDDDAWDLQRSLVESLQVAWSEPDHGIWEVRGARRHFTHSKVMAWVAIDRSIRDAKRYGFDAPLDSWRALRDTIHREVVERGWSASRCAFTQAYDHDALDASLLLMPVVGFLPPADPRVIATVDAIQRELDVDGLIRRYETSELVDGLPAGEGAFLPCSFWLVDALTLIGRRRAARRLFERLLALRSDLGLLAEEYDPARRRLVGNFPQAFSHVALVHAAQTLHGAGAVASTQQANGAGTAEVPR